MSGNLATNLQTYVKNIRNVLAKDDVYALFPTRNGTAFPSGTIGKRVIQFWKKATGKEITSTKLRKFHASNLIHEEEVGKRSAHTLMCHSARTAEKHYMIHRIADAAIQGHGVLSANLGLKETEETPVNQPTEVPTQRPPPPSPPSTLTELQKDDIDLLFADVITKNVPLTILKVKNTMSDSLHLVHLVDHQQTVTQVYKRIKYLQGKHMKHGIEAVPEDHDKDLRTAQWLETSFQTPSSHSRRFVWCADDVEVIEKEFAAYKKCPQKKTIMHEFSSCAPLKEIADRVGINRCYEKVKTTFKQRTNT